MSEQCSNCKFGKVANEMFAICRRYPPTTPAKSINNWNQPLMIGSDWCGEYRKKETESGGEQPRVTTCVMER